MAEEIVRVFRLMEYVGERSIVEDIITKSIHGTRDFGFLKITAVTLDIRSEGLTDASQVSAEKDKESSERSERTAPQESEQHSDSYYDCPICRSERTDPDGIGSEGKLWQPKGKYLDDY